MPVKRKPKTYDVKIQHIDYEGAHETITVRVVADSDVAAENAVALNKIPREWKGHWQWMGTKVVPEGEGDTDV